MSKPSSAQGPRDGSGFSTANVLHLSLRVLLGFISAYLQDQNEIFSCLNYAGDNLVENCNYNAAF